MRYLVLENHELEFPRELPIDLVKRIIPIVDKKGNPHLDVEYWDDEFCLNSAVFCDGIQVINKEEKNPLESLSNNQVQDILEDLGMLDENGNCPYTAEEIFKAGIEYLYNKNYE